MSDPFNDAWAKSKLNFTRRRRELKAHIDKWLPELKDEQPGLVIDIGCGPGDFLHMCRTMGHSILGIDTDDGIWGMGDAYLKRCARARKIMGIPTLTYGLQKFIIGDAIHSTYQTSVLWHFRGSIEQCFAPTGLIGPSHSKHHNSQLQDWDCTPLTSCSLGTIILAAVDSLRPGGILLIHANGTGTTDIWYDSTMRSIAEKAGLELVAHEGLLLHKWEKRQVHEHSSSRDY